MAVDTEDLNEFRAEARAWLEEKFPQSLRGRAGEIMAGEGTNKLEGDALIWSQRLGEKGWGAPTWPSEYPK